MKKLIFILLLCLPLLAYAEPPVNEKYSFKDFMGQSFKNVPAEEFNNSIIQGSCFYNEWKEGDAEIAKDIFPDGMIGVTFKRCNLDNVFVDETKNTVIKNGYDTNSNRKIQVQNDLSDWELDDTLKPKEPLDKEQRLKAGISIDPKDIPNKKLTKEEREQLEDLFQMIQ